MQYLLAAIIGLVSGVASGLFGVGGGIVMVPAMILLLAKDPKIAVGTSLAVIIPTAVVGVLKHHSLSQIDWRTAALLMPTAMLGGFGGAWLTSHISSENLKRSFGAFLIVVGLRLLVLK